MAPPYYSQRAVFASPLSAFFIGVVILDNGEDRQCCEVWLETVSCTVFCVVVFVLIGLELVVD